MSNKFFKFFILLCAVMLVFTLSSMLLSRYADEQRKIMPEGFVYVSHLAPEIITDLRFYNDNNFTGGRVAGYEANAAILLEPAAQALAKANEAFMAKGYTIKLWDAYRPKAAQNQFQRWLIGSDDTRLKPLFYPRHTKPELARLGYLPARSEHSTGGAVDITLVNLETGQDLDMGSDYAYMDELSSVDAPVLSTEQRHNRELLHETMTANGFIANDLVWWHFHLADEPGPDSYFDFPITAGDES